MDVLVTDGDQRATLAVVRSCGRKGLRVAVGEERRRSLAGCSRYCSSHFVYPSPVSDPVGFQRALFDHVQTHQYKLLIPMTDVTCTLTAEIREQLRSSIAVALPDGDTYMRASDKADLVKLAQSLGIPTPATLFPENPSQLSAAGSGLNYPVVLKPRRSRLRVGNSWVYGHVEYAHSPDELMLKFAQSYTGGIPPLVQERIEGPGVGLFALCLNGEPVAMFAHRRLREKPPSGGVSVLRESAPLDENLRASACQLLKALNWTGVAMVEFKLDNCDQTPKLMELNGRFWGSLQLAIDSGVDFPNLLFQISQGEGPVPINSYAVGVRSRWFLGDLDHLLTIWLHRARTLSLPANYPGRFAVLRDFVTETWSSSKNEIWQTDDLAPARRELIEYLASAFKGLTGRLRPGKKVQ